MEGDSVAGHGAHAHGLKGLFPAYPAQNATSGIARPSNPTETRFCGARWAGQWQSTVLNRLEQWKTMLC